VTVLENWIYNRKATKTQRVIFCVSLWLCVFVVTSHAQTRKNPKDDLTYAFVPAGVFRMGCSDGDKECYEDERPTHSVQISKGFWMGQTEVIVAAFEAFTKAKGVDVAVPPDQKGKKYPVMAVTWDEAAAYCKWAGGRLPTEAEWEYAARGCGSSIRYGDLNAIAWTSANSQHTVHEAGKKQPNAYQLYDMLGNVWEWTADWYGAKYYEQSPAVDPIGPPIGDVLISKGVDLPTRTIRGGAWIGFPGVARASYRYWFIPTLRVANIGFRCVLKEES
jgi:formylglycine-generating enzyme required for sulfatase activity